MRELTRSNVISCFIWTSYYFPSKPIKKEFSLRSQSMLYWNADFSLLQNSPLKTTNTFFSLFFSVPFWGNVLCSGIIGSEIPIFPIISKGPNWNILSTFWTAVTSVFAKLEKARTFHHCSKEQKYIVQVGLMWGWFYFIIPSLENIQDSCVQVDLGFPKTTPQEYLLFNLQEKPAYLIYILPYCIHTLCLTRGLPPGSLCMVGFHF